MPAKTACRRPVARPVRSVTGPSSIRSGVALATDRLRPNADLVIGALPNTVRGLLPNVLGRLRQQLPHAAVQVVDGNDRQLQARLASGQIDVLIGRAPHNRDLGQFRFLPLYEDRVPFVVRPHHPLANYGSVEPADMARYHFLAPQFDMVLAAEVERHLYTEGFATILEPTTADSVEFALAFIHQSDCILAVPDGIVRTELRGHRLVELAVTRPLSTIPIGALTAPQTAPAAPTALLTLLLDALTEQAKVCRQI